MVVVVGRRVVFAGLGSLVWSPISSERVGGCVVSARKPTCPLPPRACVGAQRPPPKRPGTALPGCVSI